VTSAGVKRIKAPALSSPILALPGQPEVLTRAKKETGAKLTVNTAWHITWNKIEHRLFSQITLNWRGRPLTSHQVIVDLITNTKTATGLSVRAVLDTGQYPTGISYSDKDIAALPLVRHDFHGDWNYTLLPHDTP
jgi:hypothetical protein